MLLDEVLHLLLGEGIDGLGQLHAVLAAPILNELVRPEPLLALPAVHQRIGEAGQMAAGHPGLGVHEDGGVLPHVVGILLNELLPPCLFDVVLQLHAQRAVVPGVGQTSVNFRAGKDEAPVFAQGHDLVHGFFRVFHDDSPLYDDFSSVKIKNALNCRRSSGRTEKSVVPPEFGSLHTLVPLTGLPAGISSRSSGPPRPSSPVTLQGYHVFPRPSRENFSGFGRLPPEAQKKNCWEKWAVGDTFLTQKSLLEKYAVGDKRK